MSKLNADDAILVVVDYQEKLFPSMDGKENAADKTAKLIKGCRLLGVPVIATQQYTSGLGETIDVIKNALTESIDDDIPAVEFRHIEKRSFSCMDEPNFREALIKSGREQVILCGIESHICVQQTALDLYEYGDEEEYDEEDYEYDTEKATNNTDNVVILIDRNDDKYEEEYMGADFEVFLACDCIASRSEFDRDIAIKRMSDTGIELITMESALFEMTGSSENPVFRRISKTVK